LVVELLIRFVKKAILNYLRGVTSIMMQGSAARNEASLFSDREGNILLGNIGFTVITKSLIRDVLSYPLLLRFLRNIDKSNLNEVIQKPLILLKPFEVSLIPYRYLSEGYVPPDIWVFEMVKAGKIVYGENVLSLFNTTFGLDAGFRMVTNRLFGLNLCLPLIARSDFDSKVKMLAVNYESVKGILAALEALLFLLGKYRPTYSERGPLASEVVEAYAETFEETDDALETFKLASKLKLDPHGLERLSPIEYWFKSRSLLGVCLKIYNFQGNSKRYKLRNDHGARLSHVTKVKDVLKFIANGKFDPRILLPMDNVEETATRLMLSCVFSMTPRLCGKPSGVKKLISASRYSNFLHTRGEWYEITDHLKYFRPN